MQLACGLTTLGLETASRQRRKLLDFLHLLEKWNRVYNLTAVRDLQTMVTHHILDSVAVAPFVTGPRVLDVASGAGLPGIPLALVLESLHISLLDSSDKRACFLRQAVMELGLGNVDVVCERVETFRPDQPFDTLVTRAFASISSALLASGHLCARGGRIVLMKGVYPRRELANVPQGYVVQEVQSLLVPGLEAARHVAVITPA